jgi:hypothetical protein
MVNGDYYLSWTWTFHQMQGALATLKPNVNEFVDEHGEDSFPLDLQAWLRATFHVTARSVGPQVVDFERVGELTWVAPLGKLVWHAPNEKGQVSEHVVAGSSVSSLMHLRCQPAHPS